MIENANSPETWHVIKTSALRWGLFLKSSKGCQMEMEGFAFHLAQAWNRKKTLWGCVNTLRVPRVTAE
ncbi:hypothetical protein Q1695_009421 [Nippostrongylus brasiliensis]|nr:hypothetical protein Q1695_009421 [Nippostrongylus brasiliensis]